MIKFLLNKRLELIAITLHVIIGIVSTFTPYPFVFFVLAVMGTSFLDLLLFQNKNNVMTYTLAYLLGIEVFSRMARAPLTGLLPDEIGKYFPLLVLFITFLIEGKMRSKGLGWWIIILTLPSLLLIDEGLRRYGIVFNYLGIFNLALMLLYFSEKKVDFEQLNNIFRLIVLPLIGALVFITIKTPDFDEIEFELRASHTMAGGYGSNQVSTALGIGMMIMAYFYLTKQRLFSIKYLDEFLLGYFFFRGLLTFSRGGMMVPIFGLLVFYLILKNANQLLIAGKTIRKLKWTNVFFSISLVAIVFAITNEITGGQLLKRYKGETVGTEAGVQEIDLNHFTSNRVEIALEDLALWVENPFFGVGPGMSKFVEGGHLGFGSHVEFSRLAAEHGIFGVIVVIMLVVSPILAYKKIKEPMHKAIFALFILVSILTSFHAAMRTMVTPFFYGLAFAQFQFSQSNSIVRNKNSVSR